MSNEKEVNLGPDSAPEPQKIDENKPKPKLDIKADASPDEIARIVAGKSQDELLPWESVTLPSQGVYYDGQIPNGVISVRAMGLYTDKIFATARLVQSGQAIDEVFKKCVRFPGSFSPTDLLMGDRTFLLFYLRGITHGNIYEFMMKCQNEACGSMSQYSYDFNDLWLTIKHPQFEKEPVRVELPYLTEITGRKFWVDVRFIRGNDMLVMAQRKKVLDKISGTQARNVKSDEDRPKESLNKVINIDQSIEDNLNLVTVNVNGNAERHIIQQIMSKLHGRDSSAIREFLNKNSPGIDTQIMVNCPSCGQEMRIELPITESFFRSKDTRGVRS